MPQATVPNYAPTGPYRPGGATRSPNPMSHRSLSPVPPRSPIAPPQPMVPPYTPATAGYSPNVGARSPLPAGPPRSLTPVSHINAQQPERFVPAGTPRLPTATASTSSGSMGGLGLVSHSSSRSLATPAGSGGQRTPFVPGGRFS